MNTEIYSSKIKFKSDTSLLCRLINLKKVSFRKSNHKEYVNMVLIYSFIRVTRSKKHQKHKMTLYVFQMY